MQQQVPRRVPARPSGPYYTPAPLGQQPFLYSQLRDGSGGGNYGKGGGKGGDPYGPAKGGGKGDGEGHGYKGGIKGGDKGDGGGHGYEGGSEGGSKGDGNEHKGGGKGQKHKSRPKMGFPATIEFAPEFLSCPHCGMGIVYHMRCKMQLDARYFISSWALTPAAHTESELGLDPHVTQP